MAKRIIWTRQAQEDRILILQYWDIKNQSKVYSKKLNLLLEKAIALISEMPNIGRRTDIERVRAKLVKNYMFFMKKRKEQSIFFQFGTAEEILKERLTNSNITDSIL